jgi:3-oxoacyl-[acyl-carrier-protein] synthase II
MKKIYVISAKQISIQQPLCEDWMAEPLRYEQDYVRCVDPDFKQFISAGEARRMGKLLKRALATSLSALSEGGIEHPDAVITGTGFGSVENTELFLDAMVREGESLLKPTQFMQSTHNTTSSLISIHTKSHGYNSTYSQKHLSFDSALYDAWLQFRLGRIHSALVGGHDEMSTVFHSFMRKAGFLSDCDICSEAAVSVLLSDEPSDKALCTLGGVWIKNRPSSDEVCAQIRKMLDENGLSPEDVGVVMTGMNGSEADADYAFLDDVLPKAEKLRYKPLFGDCFSAPALGVYASCQCLAKGQVPASLTADNAPRPCGQSVLVVNIAERRHCSLILLSRN